MSNCNEVTGDNIPSIVTKRVGTEIIKKQAKTVSSIYFVYPEYQFINKFDKLKGQNLKKLIPKLDHSFRIVLKNIHYFADLEEEEINWASKRKY